MFAPDVTLTAMVRRVFMSSSVIAAVVMAGCSNGNGSETKTPSTVGRSHISLSSPPSSAATANSDLVVIVPEAATQVHASKVYLGASDNLIGLVVEVEAVSQHEARLRIALTNKHVLHLDASATVCDNAMRLSPGSPGKRFGGSDLVIPVVRTSIHLGDC